MMKGIYAVASAMRTEQQALDMVANNLANAETPGFRKAELRRAGFAEIMADQGQRGPLDGAGGAGVAAVSTWTSFNPGTLKVTEQPYDLALSGPRGFFQVRTPEGQLLLTRNGNFTPDDNGILRDPRGNALQGQGGDISVPENVANVTIDGEGILTITDSNNSDINQQTLDQVRVVEPVAGGSPRDWAKIDGQYFDPGDNELVDVLDPAVRQGHLENSNGNPIEDLVHMVKIQRRYDGAARVLNGSLEEAASFSDILRGG
jgi:flagellar basal body rod protein FlgG